MYFGFGTSFNLHTSCHNPRIKIENSPGLTCLFFNGIALKNFHFLGAVQEGSICQIRRTGIDLLGSHPGGNLHYSHTAVEFIDKSKNEESKKKEADLQMKGQLHLHNKDI